MSKLHVISDVHTEHFKFDLTKAPKIEAENADVVALVGDIGDPCYQDYIEKFSGKFEKVFVVAGNHEFYQNEYHSTLKQMEYVASKFKNVSFLHEKSELHHGIRFIGSTLWSYVPPENEIQVLSCLNDYHLISIENKKEKRLLSTVDTNEFHKRELNFIKEEIKKAKENEEVVVVLTHHAPLTKGTSNPKYEGSEINCAFATELNSMMGKPVFLWAFGHTHYISDQTINGTRILSNQVGYYFERSKSQYQSTLVIDIPNDIKKLE